MFTSKWQRIQLFCTLVGIFSLNYVLLFVYMLILLCIQRCVNVLHFFSQPENEEKYLVYDNIGPNVCMGDHKVTSQA